MRMTNIASKERKPAQDRLLLLSALIGSIGTPAIVAAQTAIVAAPPAAAPSAAPANGVGSAFELTFWQSVAGSDDPAVFDAYLARYPDGTFSGLARARVAAIQRALTVQPAGAAPAPSPAANPAVAPALAPAPAATPVPAVLTTPEAAPVLSPTPAMVTAATPTAAPGPAAAMPQSAEMVPVSAPVAPAEQSSPLAKLLAQLRGTGSQAAVAAAPATAAPLASTATPVQPALVPATGSGLQLAAVAVPAAAQSASAPAAAPVAALAPTATPAAAPAPSYSSARPVLLPVPDLALPAYFCGNDARNAFHNNAYRPAVEAATRNNEAAVNYLRQLQQTYDRGQLGRDTAVLNAIAAEARAYQAEAAKAYSAQAVLVRQFDALMAIPLHTCVASAQ